ncbi:hypothetical protein Hanom_Chr10g00915691 [Helianthus anomalus]
MQNSWAGYLICGRPILFLQNLNPYSSPLPHTSVFSKSNLKIWQPFSLKKPYKLITAQIHHGTKKTTLRCAIPLQITVCFSSGLRFRFRSVFVSSSDLRFLFRSGQLASSAPTLYRIIPLMFRLYNVQGFSFVCSKNNFSGVRFHRINSDFALISGCKWWLFG